MLGIDAGVTHRLAVPHALQTAAHLAEGVLHVDYEQSRLAGHGPFTHVVASHSLLFCGPMLSLFVGLGQQVLKAPGHVVLLRVVCGQHLGGGFVEGRLRLLGAL